MSNYQQDNEEYMRTWAAEVVGSRIDYLVSQGMKYEDAFIVAWAEYDGEIYDDA